MKIITVAKLTLSVSLIFISLILSNISYAKINPETCVGLWLFDEGEGDVAKDSSGNGNDGTLINEPQWVDGQFDKALYFDGVDDHVDCGNDASLDLTDAITIMAWAKLDALDQMAGILEKRLCGTNNGYALLNGWSRNTYMELTNLGIWVQSESLETDRWYHFAATWDSGAGNASFYQDGVQVQSKAQGGGGTITLNTEALFIGARSTSCGATSFNGTVDEVAVFNKALSEEDINDIMTNGLAAALGIAAVFPSGKLATTWAHIKYE